MIINHNMSSINSNRVLKFNNLNVNKDIEFINPISGELFSEKLPVFAQKNGGITP